mmetsp:Transcript_124561/g.202585  ORF Transcript_124561/g.202585 Transcript_124561/m.202585 type:complete len:106 (+) Transcript_124561:778-1095(+)
MASNMEANGNSNILQRFLSPVAILVAGSLRLRVVLWPKPRGLGEGDLVAQEAGAAAYALDGIFLCARVAARAPSCQRLSGHISRHLLLDLLFLFGPFVYGVGAVV